MGRWAGFAAMSVIWGLTWIAMKTASAVVPPIFLAAVRFNLAGAIFLLAALALRLPIRAADPVRVVASSFLITTVTYATSFWGVAHAPSGLAAIVNLSLLPIFVMALGALYGEEVVTGRRIGAIALGIGGLVFLFATRGAGPAGQPSPTLGLLAVVVGTIAYAWGAVISRPLLRTMAPIALATWQTLIGGVLLAPVSILLEGWDPSRFADLADPRALFGLVVLVAGGSLTAFLIYLWLLRDWGPFRAGLYCFVSPIVAVATGVVWAGEAFSWPEAVGMALMLAATALAVRPPEPSS